MSYSFNPKHGLVVVQAQMLNYLKATRPRRRLLLNFGCTSLEFKRLIFRNLHC